MVPQSKAGGSMAAQAYNHFEEPVVIEEIEANVGIDIGFTLIGMHLKRLQYLLDWKIIRWGSSGSCCTH